MLRRSGIPLAAGACIALLAALAPDRYATGQGQTADTSRVEGEYGLMVTRDADSIRVAWLTRTAAPGWLHATSGERTRHEVTTPAGTAHATKFKHAGGGTVVLHYGAANDSADRHQTTLFLDAARRRPRVAHSGVDSLFVLGDIHGEFDTVLAVLRNAGVIDSSNHWSAGRAHLAIVGDMMDRGPDVTRLLWFLYGLEPQAERAGGRLHIVLGNHEIMVMLDDLRYVHPKEQSLALAHGVTYDRMFDPRQSILGSWLASKPALIRVDDVLLAHGGVSTDYLSYTLQSYDDSLAAYTGEDMFYRWADTTFVVQMDSASFVRRNDFFWGDGSVFWYRGYALVDTLGPALEAVLRRYRGTIHVVGHTPGPTIRERYGGSLIAVNTAPFAEEMLLLVRKNGAYERWRFRKAGPPVGL